MEKERAFFRWASEHFKKKKIKRTEGKKFGCTSTDKKEIDHWKLLELKKSEMAALPVLFTSFSWWTLIGGLRSRSDNRDNKKEFKNSPRELPNSISPHRSTFNGQKDWLDQRGSSEKIFSVFSFFFLHEGKMLPLYFSSQDFLQAVSSDMFFLSARQDASHSFRLGYV